MLLLGFIAQALLGYWLLYRSIINDTAVHLGYFALQLHQADNGIRGPYLQHSSGWHPSGYWSVSTRRSIGRLTARSTYGNPYEVPIWYAFPPYRMGSPKAFRDDVPRHVARVLLEEIDGELLPRQEERSTVVAESCGWPMLSFVAFDFGDGTTGTTEWSEKGGFVFEHARARGQGTVMERALIPYQPLLLGSIVNSVIFAALLLVLFAAARGARRLIRYERGRCPRCAYDLRREFHHGCSECGWGREA